MNIQPQSPAQPAQTLLTVPQQTRMQSRQHLLRRARDIRQHASSSTELWLAAQYEAAAQLL